jgi:MFS family permease
MRQRSGPLARREFRLYFAGNVASNVGNWLANVALSVYVHGLTRSSFWVGLVNAALFIPVILFALPAGAMADRTDRIRLLRRSQVMAFVLAGTLTGLAAAGAATRFAVLAIAAGLGVTVAFGIPAMQSMIPSLVPRDELSEAIGLNALTFNLARALGPVLAAAAITTVGATWAFGLNALSFVPLIVVLTVIRRAPFQRASEGPPGPISEGLRYAWTNVRIRSMLLAMVAVSISLDPITTLSPALARAYGLSTGSAGWIVSAWGAGAVLGITAGRRFIAYVTKHGAGWMGLVLQGAGLVLLGAAGAIGLALPAALVVGVGYIVAAVSFVTTIQADVPERLRGRVMSLWLLSFLGPRVVAAVVDGALADSLGPHVATACFAAPAVAAAWLVRRVAPPPGTAEPVAPAA